MLFALTLPGLVLLLLALAVVEHTASRLRRRSLITRQQRTGLTATGLDFMAVLTMPNKELELDQRALDKVRRVDPGDGSPGGGSLVDLEAGHVTFTRRA